eukprot:SAG11_NODE_17885_length_506_cov_1.068796_1_plen_64_part_00
MNILDLNEDIMSKVKHNIFLKRLMKHREDNFKFNELDWDKWEFINDDDIFYLDRGDRGKSFSF